MTIDERHSLTREIVTNAVAKNRDHLVLMDDLMDQLHLETNQFSDETFDLFLMLCSLLLQARKRKQFQQTQLCPDETGQS